MTMKYGCIEHFKLKNLAVCKIHYIVTTTDCMIKKKAPPRFELGISCLLDRRFNQLSHGADVKHDELYQTSINNNICSCSLIEFDRFLKKSPGSSRLLNFEFQDIECRILQRSCRKWYGKFKGILGC